jgi:hypothetical protein
MQKVAIFDFFEGTMLIFDGRSSDTLLQKYFLLPTVALGKIAA